MNATKNAPFNGFDQLNRDLNTMFNELFGQHRAPKNAEQSGSETAVSNWHPRTDLAENEASYLIHLDLPGMTKENITISFHDEVLTVKGERSRAAAAEGTTFYRTERLYGTFSRSFRMPKPVKAHDIKATFEQGVLTIEVPKAEEVKPVNIEII